MVAVKQSFLMMKLSSGHLAELAKLSQVWAWPGDAP